MNCIDNIIGVRGVCGNEDTPSLSGYYVNDYPGITLQTASNSTNENILRGYDYLIDLRRRAMLRLNNDVLSYINNNFRTNILNSGIWKSGEYLSGIIQAGSQFEQRGIVVYKQNLNCRFKKIKINTISVYSALDAEVNLRIADITGTVYTLPVELSDGKISKFEINKTFEGNEIQITLPSNVLVHSTKPYCGVGCGNTPKSECVRVYGLNNGQTNINESYGIIVEADCICDLSTLVCRMASDNIIGQAAYELFGAMFYDEMLKNNRLNYLTIYKSEEIAQQASQGFNMYRDYLNNSMQGIRRYLTQLDGNCNCIDCKGLQSKTSV